MDHAECGRGVARPLRQGRADGVCSTDRRSGPTVRRRAQQARQSRWDPPADGLDSGRVVRAHRGLRSVVSLARDRDRRARARRRPTRPAGARAGPEAGERVGGGSERGARGAGRGRQVGLRAARRRASRGIRARVPAHGSTPARLCLGPARPARCQCAPARGLAPRLARRSAAAARRGAAAARAAASDRSGADGRRARVRRRRFGSGLAERARAGGCRARRGRARRTREAGRDPRSQSVRRFRRRAARRRARVRRAAGLARGSPGEHGQAQRALWAETIYATAIEHPDGRVRLAAMGALGTMSGRGLVTLQEVEWQRWWQTEGAAAFRAPAGGEGSSGS